MVGLMVVFALIVASAISIYKAEGDGSAFQASLRSRSPGLWTRLHRNWLLRRGAAVTSAVDGALPPVKAVLWDVDGTLVDSTRMAFAATNEVLKKHGYPEVSEADYKIGSKYTTPRRFAFHAGCEDLADPVGEKLGNDFDALYVGLVTPSMVPLFDGLAALLGELCADGCGLGALSNACGEYVRKVLAEHGLGSSFAVQLGADEVPAAKPSPDGLLKCCELLGCSPSECAYVGDAPTDGAAAKAAGMRCIGITWGSHVLDASHFDVLVDSSDALRAVLSAWRHGNAIPDQRREAPAVPSY